MGLVHLYLDPHFLRDVSDRLVRFHAVIPVQVVPDKVWWREGHRAVETRLANAVDRHGTKLLSRSLLEQRSPPSIRYIAHVQLLDEASGFTLQLASAIRWE